MRNMYKPSRLLIKKLVKVWPSYNKKMRAQLKSILPKEHTYCSTTCTAVLSKWQRSPATLLTFLHEYVAV